MVSSIVISVFILYVKQKTAYEMRISDWSSDVCSSDLVPVKTVDQQARLAWHRVREGYKTEVLATSNRIRGVLAEFGVVMARNDQALLRVLGDTAMRTG